VLAAGTLPIEAQVFQVWYFALYPEKLSPDVDTAPHRRVFPDLSSKKRSDQKKALREVIAKFRGDPEIMYHRQTDARPLVLPPDCGEADRSLGDGTPNDVDQAE
jgi:hypothetical protein